jgi:hypothetical protein
VTRTLPTLALVFAFAVMSTAMAAAQDKPPAPAPAAKAGPPTALKVQVMISRFQGDKKISSYPYTLSVTGNPSTESRNLGFIGRANLRMGAKVPIVVTTFGPPVDAKPPIQSYNYQDVGTNIDCSAFATEDGRFRLEITIDDSSVYPDEKDTPGTVKGVPSMRTFRASDSMMLKDGGSSQFTAATDKVSGEIVKVDVTLTVVK